MKARERLFDYVRPDRVFLARRKELENFLKQFNACDSETLNLFPHDQLSKCEKIIEECLARTKDAEEFIQNLEEAEQDITKDGFI